MKASLLASLAGVLATVTAVATAPSFSPFDLLQKPSGGIDVAAFSPFDLLQKPTGASFSPYDVLQKPKLMRRSHPNPEVLLNATFEQLLDHSDPSKGTFQQRYWYNIDYWAGPGSPIFLLNPGEQDATTALGFLTNDTLSGAYAQLFNGAVIVIEHRYWGASQPFTELTAETLQYLNIPQAISDMTHFAQTVSLPFDTTGGSNADKAPWVLMGGSYSGALAAWTQQLQPGVFHAYHASSAVVEAVYDFWTYYVPVEAGLPRNCSADIRAVISYVDSVFASGNRTKVARMKEVFGLPTLQDADFAAILARPIAQWQSNNTKVFAFCDFIETAHSNGTVLDPTDPNGVGLNKAFDAYSAMISYTFGEKCAQGGCDSYNVNPTTFNNPTDFESDRQWTWLLCNEPLSWWQNGPPVSDGTNIISAALRPDHYQRFCDMYFPATNGWTHGSAVGWIPEDLNQWTGGWNATFERVLFVDGEFDPWRSASLTSLFRPGGPRESTEQTPILIMKGGVHTPDMVLKLDEEDWLVTVKQELAIMKQWLSEWQA